ncbi:hypothetical protein DLM77_03625 [Leptospira yasudae]|uniref:Uncharacterized protein n=1 Tax=Leptospira yasudae TaxID=2202201 RepID=A0ABX9M6N7_9LEPT|nr:hypothetical protein DLM77_03625 [Leptospira yasudae]
MDEFRFDRLIGAESATPRGLGIFFIFLKTPRRHAPRNAFEIVRPFLTCSDKLFFTFYNHLSRTFVLF